MSSAIHILSMSGCLLGAGYIFCAMRQIRSKNPNHKQRKSAADMGTGKHKIAKTYAKAPPCRDFLLEDSAIGESVSRRLAGVVKKMQGAALPSLPWLILIDRQRAPGIHDLSRQEHAARTGV
ncbi:hypothetical protein [Mesorhizobium sp. M0488]|uniref:hypothetical protein n=1 Tax=unclassified Mesorhizobium TaxID=325217 RepID=UPI00333A8AA5